MTNEFGDTRCIILWWENRPASLEKDDRGVPNGKTSEFGEGHGFAVET